MRQETNTVASNLTDFGREWLGRELDKAQARADQELLIALATRVRRRGERWSIPIDKELAARLSEYLGDPMERKP